MISISLHAHLHLFPFPALAGFFFFTTPNSTSYASFPEFSAPSVSFVGEDMISFRRFFLLQQSNLFTTEMEMYTVEWHNVAVAWSQALDMKGEGLPTGVAPLPLRKTPATETGTIEHNDGRRMKATKETGSMTDVSETQPGADIQRADILRPKPTRRMGCWNVLTLYQTGPGNSLKL